MADRDDLPYIIIERRGGGVGAFLLGALLGAGAALLAAPRSGVETRGELRSNLERLRDRAGETVREFQGAVSGTIDDVRGEVTGRVDAARDAFEAGRQAARDTRTEMERRVSDARTRVRAGVDAARQSGVEQPESPPASAPPEMGQDD